MKFSAHLDTLFDKLPIEERIKNFAELGFNSFELWCHWEYDMKLLAEYAKQANLQVAAIATEFIPLTRKEKHDEYLSGLVRSVKACEELDCKTIISQVGNLQPDIPVDYQEQYIINGLRAAKAILAGSGVSLVVEPLNTLVDHPGYFLTRSDTAAEIIEAVDSENVKMLFDVYHQQITEGNLIANIKKFLPLIGHFHIADNPGRHQPGTGEINFSNIFKLLEESGYKGFVGLEFLPQGDHMKVLEDFKHNYMD